MALDGSYLKQNSTPLLDLLQKVSRHTMKGVKKELPQCTTPLSTAEAVARGSRPGAAALLEALDSAVSDSTSRSFKSTRIFDEMDQNSGLAFPQLVLVNLGK